MTEDEKREALASYIHELWAGWMVYLFQFTNDYVIDTGKAQRWIRQMNTAYEDLPESEKKSDRELADELSRFLEDDLGWKRGS